MRQKLVQLIIGLCLEQHGSAFGEIVNGSTVHAQLDSYNAREKVLGFGNMKGGTGHHLQDDRSIPMLEHDVNKKQSDGMLRPLEEQESRQITSKHFRVEIPARETGDTNDHQPHSLSVSSPPHKSACTEEAGNLLLESSCRKQ